MLHAVLLFSLAAGEKDVARSCTPESLETASKFVLGYNVAGFEAEPRPRLHLRAAPGLTREWLGQVLLCLRARGEAPFNAAELDLQSELAGFIVELQSDEPAVIEAARAFAQAHAIDAEPPPPPKHEPFAFADWTWMNGNSRQTEFPMDSAILTGAFNLDVGYNYEFSQPKDHSILGSTASFRHNELQVTHLGIGADFHWHNVRGRFMTQLGLYSTTTPRNDASPARGQWNLADAYRYLAEVYGGYHFDLLYGLNIDAGIFLSYVGLCSYYNYENWTDQASYVSSNTPWFFNGIRIQFFPTEKLKIEPWIINGWQSYGVFNEMPGLGLQLQYRPTTWFALVASTYFGKDTAANDGRWRVHSDDSVLVKYFENPGGIVSRAAFSVTFDIGCENGGGVSCAGGKIGPAQYFVGFMAYNRLWFFRDVVGLTAGGGAMTNPGRYLVLTPPINGATAASGSPYFSQSPGDKYDAWDMTYTLDVMPLQFITVRAEYTHRWASVPYFVGPGGITPDGGNQGTPGSFVAGFQPDLRQNEDRVTVAVMVRL
jgi:hypothetical protein